MYVSPAIDARADNHFSEGGYAGVANSVFDEVTEHEVLSPEQEEQNRKKFDNGQFFLGLAFTRGQTAQFRNPARAVSDQVSRILSLLSEDKPEADQLISVNLKRTIASIFEAHECVANEGLVFIELTKSFSPPAAAELVSIWTNSDDFNDDFVRVNQNTADYRYIGSSDCQPRATEEPAGSKPEIQTSPNNQGETRDDGKEEDFVAECSNHFPSEALCQCVFAKLESEFGYTQLLRIAGLFESDIPSGIQSLESSGTQSDLFILERMDGIEIAAESCFSSQ